MLACNHACHAEISEYMYWDTKIVCSSESNATCIFELETVIWDRKLNENEHYYIDSIAPWIR